MAENKQDTQPKATAKKSTRKPSRSIEEQIADLKAKAQARADRRRAPMTKQYEAVVVQHDAVKLRFETIAARKAELEAQLGIDLGNEDEDEPIEESAKN